MSAGKTIIVPQGVINPNTLTVIEIPAESQHESVFVANVTGSPEQNMNCEYLFESFVHPPNQFRPRFESTPVANRPERDPTPVTFIDDSSFGTEQSFMSDSMPEPSIDYNEVFGPDYASEKSAAEKKGMKMTSQTSITHTASDPNLGGAPSRRMVTTTNLINITGSPNQAGPSDRSRPPDRFGSPNRSGTPNRSASPGRSGSSGRSGSPDQSGAPVARERPHDILADLIDMRAVERHRDEDLTPDWCQRNDGLVDSPSSFHDMEFCNAESTRIDPHPGPSAMEFSDSEAGASGSMRASMFQRLMGDDMPRQIYMPMLSPIQGARYTADGMPIGMSPSRSYYRRGRRAEHDRPIVSSIVTDESTGNTTGNTSRTGNTSGSASRSGMTSGNFSSTGESFGQSNDTGELCSGSVCAGGTYCKSAAILGMQSPQTSGSPKMFSPIRTSSPNTYIKSPQDRGVAYMQAVPTNAAANATYNMSDRIANATYNMSDRIANATYSQPGRAANATFPQPSRAANATFAQPCRAANATFTQPSRATNATFTQPSRAANATFAQPSRATNATFTQPCPGANATFTQPSRAANATFAQPCRAANATFTQPSRAVNATFAQPARQTATCVQNRTPTYRRNIPQDNSPYSMIIDGQSPTSSRYRSPSPRGRGAAMPGPPNTMENVLVLAEQREQQMIEEDLRMLQMQRRRLLEAPNMEERRAVRRNLFGPDYRENDNGNAATTGRRRARRPRPTFQSAERWRY